VQSVQPSDHIEGHSEGELKSTTSTKIRQDKLLHQLRASVSIPYNTRNMASETPDCTLVLSNGHTIDNELRQRIGFLCSDMIAQFCFEFNIECVIDLPKYLTIVSRLAQIAPSLLSFVEKIEDLVIDAQVCGYI